MIGFIRSLAVARFFAVATLLMAIAFQPTLRFYRLSPLWGIALPAIAFCYTLFTLDSALQFWRGKGGLWKGRVQAQMGTKVGTKVGTNVAEQK